MATKTNGTKGVDETLVRVIAHPLRVQALAVLAERSASPKEIAAELGSPVGNVSYHVRELEDAGLIELVDEKKRRGAVEHFYRAITRPMLDDAECEKLSLEEREQLSAWILQLLLADAAKSLGAGTFDARSDRHLSRIPLVLDEEGWRELTQLQAEALQATFEVQAASARRLAEANDPEQGVPVMAAMACFELPPRRRQAG